MAGWPDSTCEHIERTAGEAGHVRYRVEVTASDGGTRRLTFAGNIFVGAVVMTSRDGFGRRERRLIENPRRFGEFVSSEWVRRYLAERDEAGVCHVCSEQWYG